MRNRLDSFEPSYQRRRVMGLGSAAALSWVAAGAEGRTTEAPRAITRARYSLSADFAPSTQYLFTLPLDVTNFQESEDFSLQAGGKILINTSGLYRCVFACDWVGQNGTDIDLRLIGNRCKRVGSSLPDKRDDRFASVDTPGSNPPQMVRYQGEWAPGVIALGATVTTVVDMPGGIVAAGDLAFASHTALRDDVIGASAVGALIVHAKVIDADKVRVGLFNPTVAAGIVVPNGSLNVMAMSSTLTRGESADAWQWLQSATETVAAGDRIYAVIHSRVRGDYVQATRSTFLQLEKIG